MAAGPGMGTNHSRGIRRGAEPYAVRGSSGVAAGPAPNRRFLAPDGRAASDRARRRAEHQPRFDCSARFARSARIALGLPPTSSSLAEEKAPPLAPPWHGGARDPSTIVDRALADFDQLWAAGGIPHAIFPLTYQELLTLTGGIEVHV